MSEMVVTEVGYTWRDGELFMFVQVPGHDERLIGPFENQDAVDAAIDTFNVSCEQAGFVSAPGGKAN